jgi:hypothetical protein
MNVCTQIKRMDETGRQSVLICRKISQVCKSKCGRMHVGPNRGTGEMRKQRRHLARLDGDPTVALGRGRELIGEGLQHGTTADVVELLQARLHLGHLGRQEQERRRLAAREPHKDQTCVTQREITKIYLAAVVPRVNISTCLQQQRDNLHGSPKFTIKSNGNT